MSMKTSRALDKMVDTKVGELQLVVDNDTDGMPGLEPLERESWLGVASGGGEQEEESRRRSSRSRNPSRRGDSDETVWSCACTLARKQCRCGLDVNKSSCLNRLNRRGI